MPVIQGDLATGQRRCHDTRGEPVPCADSGQDAEVGSGLAWPYKGAFGLGHKPFARFHVRAVAEPDQYTSSVGAKALT